MAGVGMELTVEGQLQVPAPAQPPAAQRIGDEEQPRAVRGRRGLCDAHARAHAHNDVQRIDRPGRAPRWAG
jgi:hypothetical protein